MNTVSKLIGATIIFSAALTATAHHNEANTYMRGRPIQWEGKVTFVSWDGAHVMYQVEVKNADGIVESWQVLGGSPQRLAQRGIYKQTVNAGDTVTVAGYLNTGSKIVTPVYIVPNKPDVASSGKLFVGYLASDTTFKLPAN